MFCCTKRKDKKIESMASLLILGGVVPLAFVTVAQFGFGLHPCHFCLLQRYPYGLVIVCGIVSLLVPRLSLRWRMCVALGICGFLATGLLGLVHTGIETGFLHYTGGCVAPPVTDNSIDTLRQAIAAAPLVACNEVAGSWLGLSMASWNSLFAATMILLVFLQYRFEYKNRMV